MPALWFEEDVGTVVSRFMTNDFPEECGKRIMEFRAAEAELHRAFQKLQFVADIVAAADGEVVIARTSTSAGNWIVLYHGNSTYTVYMHCSQLLASVGQQVKQGEVIAKVGSTGYSTGPHLHFGIRTGGKYVNPLNYVSP